MKFCRFVEFCVYNCDVYTGFDCGGEDFGVCEFKDFFGWLS